LTVDQTTCHRTLGLRWRSGNLCLALKRCDVLVQPAQVLTQTCKCHAGIEVPFRVFFGTDDLVEMVKNHDKYVCAECATALARLPNASCVSAAAAHDASRRRLQTPVNWFIGPLTDRGPSPNQARPEIVQTPTNAFDERPRLDAIRWCSAQLLNETHDHLVGLARNHRRCLHHAGNVRTNPVQAQPPRRQDLTGYGGLPAQQPKQQMFGPDVAVAEAIGLLARDFEHPLGLWTERYLNRSGHFLL